MSILSLSAFALSLLIGSGCVPRNPPPEPPPIDETCPVEAAAPKQLPGVKEQHNSLAYWLEQSKDLDQVLLSAQDIEDYNHAFSALAKRDPNQPPLGHFDLTATVSPQEQLKEINVRLAYMRSKLQDGSYVARNAQPPAADVIQRFQPVASLPSNFSPTLRVVLQDTPIQCGPWDQGLFKKQQPLQLRFDRNNCSTVRAQEPIVVLMDGPGSMKLIRSRYALGWIDQQAPLSPPVPADLQQTVVHSSQFRVLKSQKLTLPSGVTATVSDHGFLPQSAPNEALVASAKGFEKFTVNDQSNILATSRPLTRRALLTEAFSYLGMPYGWGGQDNGRDCSRFLMDLFSSFGLDLPRQSILQSKAGSMQIDISSVSSLAERQALIDAAAQQGIVLLQFPGHIMLYLGRNDQGTPMAIHAFAEYLETCEQPSKSGRTETLLQVQNIQVSDLQLGKGSSRKSFIERISNIVIFAKEPGQQLLGAVSRRPAAPVVVDAKKRCKSTTGVYSLTSPRRPNAKEPVRLVVTSSRDLGSVDFQVKGPNDKIYRPKLRRLGGPPFGYWAELENLPVGRYKAHLGDGQRTETCLSFKVRRSPAGGRSGEGSVWIPGRRWSQSMENLFSTFVEQLFDYPIDQDISWSNLQTILQNRDNNLFYNFLGQNEEKRLRLTPDCADLPYFLRSYFAWKMRLPFGFRKCNRGRKGRAPTCGKELFTNLQEREIPNDVRAFNHFTRRTVGNGVHSGSGRTSPTSEFTDYYPLPITREALRPGTVFADPYGHILMVADWIPQGIGKYGVLVGADAQPDATIGRRRFWRGSFLFRPETKEAGAGFKNFRVLQYRGQEKGIVPIRNKTIRKFLPQLPQSQEQYQGTMDDFYEKVESLINPRPLDPSDVMRTLVAALEESVKRRVKSVQNGEDYKKQKGGIIEMPTGYAIFETSGAWENYSTPSRDMRLLIAMDTVLGFPEQVKRNPKRFNLSADSAVLDPAIAQLKTALSTELASRKFSYIRSDGSSFTLTLKDVADRAQAFEMSYNPNDCVEVRWAAPEKSAERSTCKVRAPQKHFNRMKQYRPWFKNRTRPSR